MITYRVDVYLSRPICASLLTSAGMPGPEGPAPRGWLGVVTGIHLIQISTGAFLVMVALWNRADHYIFIL